MQSFGTTPILIIAYNRPELFEKVAKEVSDLGLKNIYIALDAPRFKLDEEKCEKTLELANHFFPEGRVNRSEENLGCAKRISSAIDWVFETEDRVVILEDDCLPGELFFSYCFEMLEKFSDDKNIGLISGCNLVKRRSDAQNAIFMSKFGGIWGWATWKRAWPRERESLSILRDLLYQKNKKNLFENKERAYWEYFLNQVKRKKFDTWDYQWDVHRMTKGMLCIVSEANLVENIGFTGQGTNMDINLANTLIKQREALPQGWSEKKIIRNFQYEKDYFDQLVRKSTLDKLKMYLVNFLWRFKK